MIKYKRKTFEFSNKISYLGNFWLEFEKTYLFNEFSTLEFFNMRTFIQKQKILTFRTKNALFGYFRAAI